ncbi:MAG: thrombospondin type 3 repeat-containing protein, partial [Candidatus Thermoplasmatota archaeon]|nr:thrombospondin type 3 repeat-containing protein [Candidatus Thermoplasmatota archaeon]
DSEESAVVNDDGCSIEVDSDGDGVMDYEDLCPDVNATLLDNNGDGCLDDTDSDGIIDSEDECPLTESDANVSAVGCSDVQLMLLDSDADGVSDFDDACPETPSGDTVDAFGCTIENSNEDDSATFGFDSLLSGENRQVTTTVGVSALLLAFFSILQTNAVAAILPDTFRWVQVLRKNYKLTKEEMNELTYLQSITQAYYTNPHELANELNQLKADLTGRYANNEIKKKTREKLFTLIEDLLASSPSELHHIAHNEAYFGLAGSIDTEERTELLNQKLAMESQTDERPSVNERGVVNDDGFEWLESAHGNGLWWYREANTNQEWKKWE